MSSPRIRALAALSAAAVLVLAAGCGGDGDDSGDGGDSGDSSFAKQTGDEIATAAKADMRALDAVKVSGTSSSEGGSITLDIQASSAGDCTGSIEVGGSGSAELVTKDGTGWFKADEAFWRATAGDSAETVMAAVGDKWVLDTDSSLSGFCDLNKLFDSVFKDEGTGGYENTGLDEIDGQDVVKVEQADDSGSSTGYVLVDGEHYLLKIERTEGDEPGKFEFSEFNEDFDVTAPGADEVVDLSTLQ